MGRPRGQVKDTYHLLELQPDTRPVFETAFRAGPAQRRTEHSHVQSMLDQGVIEPVTAEWAFPIVVASKKDESVRFSVELRHLNALFKRDA